MAKKNNVDHSDVSAALLEIDEVLGNIVYAVEKGGVAGSFAGLTESRDVAARIARDLQDLSIRLTGAARIAASEERAKSSK